MLISNLLKMLLNQHLRFLVPILIYYIKIIFIIAHFANFEANCARNGSKTQKYRFFKM